MAATQNAIPTVSDVSTLYGEPDAQYQDVSRRTHDANVALRALGMREQARENEPHNRIIRRLHVSGHYAAKVTYETSLALTLDAGKDILVLTASLFVKLEEMQSMFALCAILLSLLVAARLLVRWAEREDR